MSQAYDARSQQAFAAAEREDAERFGDIDRADADIAVVVQRVGAGPAGRGRVGRRNRRRADAAQSGLPAFSADRSTL